MCTCEKQKWLAALRTYEGEMLVHKQKSTQAQIQKCGTKSPAYERYEKRGRQTHSFERHKVGDWVLTKLLMTPKGTEGRPSNTVQQTKSRQILCNGVYSGRGKLS